ncbi:MAG: alanine racemase [Rikenellaceae bacterium]
MRYPLSKIAQVCGAKLIGCDCTVDEILTDSRSAGGGEQALFVAMAGERHDSHDRIEEMLRRGTRAFMVEDERKAQERGSYLVVENSIEALQRLAIYHRSQFSGEVVAIIGSNGKTIIKEWAAQSYNGEGRLFRSPRSYNSQLGVALSLLMMRGDEAIALIEAGVSQCGEMERLERMIQPHTVLFSSVGDAHQEGFDSLEQKISEKLKMVSACQRLIYHSDYDELRNYLVANPISCTLIDAKQMAGAALSELHSQRNSQIVEALLRQCGCHDYDLSSFSPVAMRLEVKEGLNDSVVVDDSYNSCVNSLSIALDTLRAVAAGRPTTLILSEILQSGVSQEQLYTEVGRVIQRAGVDRVIGVGSHINRWLDCDYFASVEELLSRLKREDYAQRAILLKGNRASRFERLSHALERQCHTTRLEVNLDTMTQNLNYFRSKLSPATKLVAMVKASSYGAGDYEVAQRLVTEGVDYLAVAFVDEGVRLRERGISTPIIVLNADEDSFEPMIQMRLEPEIYSLRSLEKFIQWLDRCGEARYPIHIKIDSGMHRLGFDSSQIEELIVSLKVHEEQVRVASVFTHLSCADEAEGEQFTRSQLELFKLISHRLSDGVGYRIMRHAANSAAIDRFEESHFDGCRLGIGLHGFGLSEQHLTPIATLKSRIVQIKHYAAQSPIGYGAKGIAAVGSSIATVPIGYADGLRRDLGEGRWSMIVNGEAAPIVGRVCMDSVMIDVSGVEGAKEGDDVVIFSPQKGNRVGDMAKILGTIPYEILTSISKRVKRIYLKE